MKGLALLMAVVLVLVLGGSTVQSQDAVVLSQPGGVKVFYADGSQIWCATGGDFGNGWAGGMFIPPADSPAPVVWASCDVPFSLSGVTRVTFSPVSDTELVVELVCDDGFVPEEVERYCRPSS